MKIRDAISALSAMDPDAMISVEVICANGTGIDVETRPLIGIEQLGLGSTGYAVCICADDIYVRTFQSPKRKALRDSLTTTIKKLK